MSKFTFNFRLVREPRPDPGPKLAQAVARVLYLSAEQIMAESKELVPVVTGTLRSTGHVQQPKINGVRVSVELGYGGPAASYAAAVHENPRAGKTYGLSPSGRPYPDGTWSKVGQWKYLEEPFLLNKPKVKDRLRKAVHKTITGG